MSKVLITYSDSINNIIEKKPNWLIRYGIGSLLINLVLIFIGLSIVNYPDVVDAKITINSSIPPVDIYAKSNLEITKIFFDKDSLLVKKGDPIVAFKNTSSVVSVLKLKNLLNDYTNKELQELQIDSMPYWDSLGVIQEHYSALITAKMALKDYHFNNQFDKRIESLYMVLDNNKKSLKKTKSILSVNKKSLNLKKKDFLRFKALYEKGIISEQEFNTAHELFLDYQASYSGNDKSFINENINHSSLKKNLLEIMIEKEEYKKHIELTYNIAYDNLVNKINLWEEKFIVKSPIEGRLSLFNDLGVGNFVRAGQYLLTVIPSNIQQPIATGTFPVNNSGKVKVRNPVTIKLDAYPYQEFGIVHGTVSYISEVPVEGLYSVKIELPNGLSTNSTNAINFKQRLSGTGQIVTKEQSVLKRLFFQFENIIK